MKRKSDNVKSKKIVIISSLMVIIAGILFLSFSYFTPNITEENNYTTSGGASARTPSITYSDLSSGINLTGTYPMSDAEGLTQSSYTFNIQNNESEPIVYEISLQTETGNTIADNLVSVSINSGANVLNTFQTGNPSSGYSHSYKIKTGELEANANKDFDLKVWLNEAGTIETVQNKNWYGKIFVKARFGMLGASTIKNLVAGEPTNTTDVITKTASEGATCTNTLAYDGTADNNLRYVGADPCNYVTFNDEEAGWRIVGIMNNVDDGTGNLETRIKLVRKEPLGYYSWDTSNSEINGGNGINDWAQADLKNELNGDYLDSTLTENTNWYSGNKNAKNGVFDITKRLGTSAQNLIENALWKLGGRSSSDATASSFYTAERGTTVYSGGATSWTGKVALIYPSDYGFAVGGPVRSTCLARNLSTYNYDNCVTNDYLKSSNPNNWFLTPYSTSYIYVFNVCNIGYVSANVNYGTYGVLPAFYLKSDVAITGGDGSRENPYVFG